MAYTIEGYYEQETNQGVTDRVEVLQNGGAGRNIQFGAKSEGFKFRSSEILADSSDGFVNPLANKIQVGKLDFFPEIETAAQQTLLDDILGSPDTEFRLRWKQDGSVKWVGNVDSRMFSHPETGGRYFATLRANDFEILKSIDYGVTDKRQTLIETIAELLGYLNYGLKIRTATSWITQETTDTTDFLSQIYHDTLALREFAQTGDEVDQPISVWDALQKVAEPALLIRQVDGEFTVEQITEFHDPANVHETLYNTDGTVDTATTTVDRRQNAFKSISDGSLVVKRSSQNDRYAGIKQARVTYDHRSQLGYLLLPNNVYINGVGNEAYSKAFIVDEDQQISFQAQLRVKDTTDNPSAEVDLMVRVGQKYWNGSTWTEDSTDRVTATLNGGGLQDDEGNYIYTGAFNFQTNSIPTNATSPMEIIFYNAEINADPNIVADQTAFENIEFSITNIQDSEANSRAINYKLTQSDGYASVLQLDATWHGEGPTATAPGALRYGTGDDTLAINIWQRRGSTSYRHYHENLLKEILDLQRSNTRKLSAEFWGTFDPKSILVYDGGNYYCAGFTYSGGRGRWIATLYKVGVQTASDTFEEVLKFSGGGSGSASSTGGGGTTIKNLVDVEDVAYPSTITSGQMLRRGTGNWENLDFLDSNDHIIAARINEAHIDHGGLLNLDASHHMSATVDEGVAYYDSAVDKLVTDSQLTFDGSRLYIGGAEVSTLQPDQPATITATWTFTGGIVSQNSSNDSYDFIHRINANPGGGIRIRAYGNSHADAGQVHIDPWVNTAYQDTATFGFDTAYTPNSGPNVASWFFEGPLHVQGDSVLTSGNITVNWYAGSNEVEVNPGANRATISQFDLTTTFRSGIEVNDDVAAGGVKITNPAQQIRMYESDASGDYQAADHVVMQLNTESTDQKFRFRWFDDSAGTFYDIFEINMDSAVNGGTTPWVNFFGNPTVNGTDIPQNLEDLNDTSITASPTDGSLLYYNTSVWSDTGSVLWDGTDLKVNGSAVITESVAGDYAEKSEENLFTANQDIIYGLASSTIGEGISYLTLKNTDTTTTSLQFMMPNTGVPRIRPNERSGAVSRDIYFDGEWNIEGTPSMNALSVSGPITMDFASGDSFEGTSGGVTYWDLTTFGTGTSQRGVLRLYHDDGTEGQLEVASDGYKISNSTSGEQIKLLDAGGINATGTLSVNSNTVWHAGNLSDPFPNGGGQALGTGDDVDFAAATLSGLLTAQAKAIIDGDDSGPNTSGSAFNGIVQLNQPTNDIALEIGIKSGSPRYVWLQGSNISDHAFSAYNISLNPLGGKVGIGTDSPGKTLEVSGDVEVSGTLTENGSAVVTQGELTNYARTDQDEVFNANVTIQYGIAGNVQFRVRNENASSGAFLDVLADDNDDIIFRPISTGNKDLYFDASADGGAGAWTVEGQFVVGSFNNVVLDGYINHGTTNTPLRLYQDTNGSPGSADAVYEFYAGSAAGSTSGAIIEFRGNGDIHCNDLVF